jgi:hypothetical protein
MVSSYSKRFQPSKSSLENFLPNGYVVQVLDSYWLFGFRREMRDYEGRKKESGEDQV